LVKGEGPKRKQPKAGLRESVPRARVKSKSFKPNEPWHLNFSLIDREGPFAWPAAGPQALTLPWWLQIMNSRFDRQEIFEAGAAHISGYMHHAVLLEDCTKSAQERLNALLKADNPTEQIFVDSIFSFRYCTAPHSTQRVWGIFDENIYYVLWWDPGHGVFGGRRDVSGSGSCADHDCLHLTESAESLRFNL